MKKDIFKNFWIDHLAFTVVYFIGNFLVGLFYYISTDCKVEILYPTALALFVYLIFIIYRLVIYSNFNIKLGNLVDNINYDVKAYSKESEAITKVISKIHKNYIEKINYYKAEDKSKKQFISEWIHNMKTPISVTDLILQKTLKGEIDMKKALNDIKEENQNLLNKLEQVLNLMRLENFTVDYVPEAVDLVSTVRKVINNRKSQFIYNRVYPILHIEDERVQVLSDAKWNEAMIEQIVSNAIKYSNVKEKNKNIYFTILKKEDKVLLSIRDEGVGIPSHDMNRIFNPFFTGDNGREYEDATGIGLYFCMQVAKRLGHDIKVNSKVGEGTEVIIAYLSKL